MTKKNQIFELNLEDYSMPRYMSIIKPYYGTMSEIIDMMIRLEDNEHTATRYKETLDAADYYDLDNELTHTVAGQTLPIFTPVKELSSLETTRHSVSWEYKTLNGTLYPCKAAEIALRQSLIQTPTGYEVCLRANIIGLQICYPGIGWILPNYAIKGFPGMVTFADNIHSMSLAVSQAHYEFCEYEWAMAEAMDPNAADLSRLVADILAEG